jgi:hypothetical protein
MAIFKRLAERFQDWNSRRKIWGYQRRLSQLGPRRSFLTGVATLFLTPFLPAPMPAEKLKERILAEYMKTVKGRSHLAQVMISPLRAKIDYTRLSRQLIPVEPMPQGALSFYKEEDPS